MFRSVAFAAIVAAPFVMNASANAQSFIAVDAEVTQVAPAPSAPLSIMQRYVPPGEAAPRELGLLVGDMSVAPPAPVAGISVTSGAPEDTVRMAVNDLAAGRTTIVVSGVRGARE